MDESYARILIMKRGRSSLAYGRGHSRQFSALSAACSPRFLQADSIHNLSEDEIQPISEKCREQEEYQDIRETSTSIHTIFLYSTVIWKQITQHFLPNGRTSVQADNP